MASLSASGSIAILAMTDTICPARAVEIGGEAIVEIGRDLGLGPFEAIRRQGRYHARAGWVWRPRHPGAPIKPAQGIARRVAFGAMRQRFGQIAATRLRLGQIAGDHEIIVQVQKVPRADRPPDVKGKADLMRLAGRICGG